MRSVTYGESVLGQAQNSLEWLPLDPPDTPSSSASSDPELGASRLSEVHPSGANLSLVFLLTSGSQGSGTSFLTPKYYSNHVHIFLSCIIAFRILY